MSMHVIRFISALLVGILVAACGEAKPATLSIEIVNKSGTEVWIDALRFTQSGTEYSLGAIQPNGGIRGHDGIAAPEPCNLVTVKMSVMTKPEQDKTFTLDLKGMCKVNEIGRDEYHLEITDQGMRVIPPAEWPKLGDPPAKITPPTGPVLPDPKFIPGADTAPSPFPPGPQPTK